MEINKYVVIDLEMNKIQYDKRAEKDQLRSEIIEIGAVIVDENLNITDTFKTYVSPEHSLLDNYIKGLTGIKYSDVESAPVFKDAIKGFIKWLPKDSIIVSWSDNDKTQIETEASSKGVDISEMENYFDTWYDCQVEFTEKMNAQRIYKLSEALVIADIDYDENIHDALVDAKNTALLFIKMKKEKVLTLNKDYNDESQCKSHTYNPFEAFFLNTKK